MYWIYFFVFFTHMVGICCTEMLSNTQNSRTLHSKAFQSSFGSLTPPKLPVFPSAGISSIAGALSCSITHSLVVPLDVVKTKMQTDVSYASVSTFKAAQQIISNKGGYNLLLQGLSATFLGYFLQGACKFGLFDHFKKQLENKKDAGKRHFRLPALVAASSCAEAIACLTLTPLERTRIQMVVNKSQVGMLNCMKNIVNQSGIQGLWLGLGPIMLKQIPYTAVKLSGYELISQPVRRILHETGKFTDEQEIFLTGLCAGVCAGVAAAVVSQPADVLLSKVCGGTNALSECLIIDGLPGLLRTMKTIGFRNSFSGLKPRSLMVGTLTAGQMIMYESTKQKLTLSFEARKNSSSYCGEHQPGR